MLGGQCVEALGRRRRASGGNLLDSQRVHAASADSHAQARHILVISDRAAPRPDLGTVRFTRQHATANLAGQRDAVTAFASSRRLQPNAVTLAAWDYRQLAGTASQTTSALPRGELPTLEVYDGAGASHFQFRYEPGAV